MKNYYAYILASDRNGTLYVGITNNLIRRLDEHKQHLNKASFTDKYNVVKLVHYEQTTSAEAAIIREKQLKKWNRAWKIELIEKNNPEWKDLAEDL